MSRTGLRKGSRQCKLTVVQLRRLLLHVSGDLVHVNQILLHFGQSLDDVVQLIERDGVRCLVQLRDDRVRSLIQGVEQVLLQLAVVVDEEVADVVRRRLEIRPSVLDRVAS